MAFQKEDGHLIAPDRAVAAVVAFAATGRDPVAEDRFGRASWKMSSSGNVEEVGHPAGGKRGTVPRAGATTDTSLRVPGGSIGVVAVIRNESRTADVLGRDTSDRDGGAGREVRPQDRHPSAAGGGCPTCGATSRIRSRGILHAVHGLAGRRTPRWTQSLKAVAATAAPSSSETGSTAEKLP